MGRDNTLISLYVGQAPTEADVQKVSQAVEKWSGSEGMKVVDAAAASEHVVLLQIAREPWITPLRTGFELDEDTALAWACGLSQQARMPAVGGVLHDSDLLGLFLVVGGREAGRLDVSDLYFDGEPSSDEDDDLADWQAVVGAKQMGRLKKLWANRASKPCETLASICALLSMDAEGADGFGSARWFVTPEVLESPADQWPVPLRILAKIGLSE